MYNSTIGNERAVKLTKNGTGDLSNQRVLEYLVLHDKDPYILTYSADLNHYDKYLPEFETMVKSFRFEN
jgi:serine/threonine-protein kinase